MWGYAISTTIALTFGSVSMLLLATGRLTMTGGTMSPAMKVTAAGISFGSCASMVAFMIFEIWAGCCSWPCGSG